MLLTSGTLWTVSPCSWCGCCSLQLRSGLLHSRTAPWVPGIGSVKITKLRESKSRRMDFAIGLSVSLSRVPLDLAWSIAKDEIQERTGDDEKYSSLNELLLNDMDRMVSAINTLQLKELWAALDHLHSAFVMRLRGNKAGMLEYFRLARDNARLAFGTVSKLHWRTLATKISMVAAFFIHSDDEKAAKHLCSKFLQSLYTFEASSEELGDGSGGGGRVAKLFNWDSKATGETLVTLSSTSDHLLGDGTILDKIPDNRAYAECIFQAVTEINEWLLFSEPKPDAMMLQPRLLLGKNSDPECLNACSWYPFFCRMKQGKSKKHFPLLLHREPPVFQLLSGAAVDSTLSGHGGNNTQCVVSASAARICCWSLPRVASDTSSVAEDEAAAGSAGGSRASNDLPENCLAQIDLQLEDNQISVGGKPSYMLVLDRKHRAKGRSVCICNGAVYSLCSRKGSSDERVWLCGWQISTSTKI